MHVVLKWFFRITGITAAISLTLLFFSPSLLELFDLQWRHAPMNYLFFLFTGAAILFLAGTACRLFVPVKGKKGKTVLNWLLGFFCLQLCLGIFVAGIMAVASNQVPEQVTERQGQKYVCLGDKNTSPYGELYEYYGPFFMGNTLVQPGK